MTLSPATMPHDLRPVTGSVAPPIERREKTVKSLIPLGPRAVPQRKSPYAFVGLLDALAVINAKLGPLPSTAFENPNQPLESELFPLVRRVTPSAQSGR